MRDPFRPTVLETLREQGKRNERLLTAAPLSLAIYVGVLVLVGWGYYALFQYLAEKNPVWALVVYLVFGAVLAVWAAWILLIMCGEIVAMFLAHCVAMYRHTIRSLDPDPRHARFLKRLREEEDSSREVRARAENKQEAEEVLEE